MAIGTLIIKERYQFSDEDVVEEIRMNPYLQYYIELSTFTHEAPFHPSTIARFRKRVTPEMLQEINDLVIGRKKVHSQDGGDPPDEPPEAGSGAPESEANAANHSKPTEGSVCIDESEATNAETMILDATCAPQNIRFPTDI